MVQGTLQDRAFTLEQFSKRHLRSCQAWAAEVKEFTEIRKARDQFRKRHGKPPSEYWVKQSRGERIAMAWAKSRSKRVTSTDRDLISMYITCLSAINFQQFYMFGMKIRIYQ